MVEEQAETGGVPGIINHMGDTLELAGDLNALKQPGEF